MRREDKYMDNEKFTWSKDKLKRGFYISLIIATGLSLAVAFFFLIYSGKSVKAAFDSLALILRPFIIGAIIAYILKSTCNMFEKLFIKLFSGKTNKVEQKAERKANILAVICTYIVWAAILSALLWIALPQVYESVSNFVSDLMVNMPGYIETISLWIADFKKSNPDLAPYVIQAESALSGWVQNDILPKIPEIGSSIILGVVDVLVFLKDFILGLVISVFFLAGRKTFAKKTRLFINCLFKENHANAIFVETRYADKMFSGFLEGKIIDSTIVGIIYFIAITIMDIPYAALLALICGVTNIIPFFGPFLGAIPSGFIILMSVDDPMKLLYFIIFVCIVQFIDGNIIDPHIVGGNIKISPFCVIFAVLLFGGFWGFWGLLIGVPTFAVIYDIVKKIIYARLIKVGKKELLREHLLEFGQRKKKPAVATSAPAASNSTQSNSPSEDAAVPEGNTNDDKSDATAGSDAADEVGNDAKASPAEDETAK